MQKRTLKNRLAIELRRGRLKNYRDMEKRKQGKLKKQILTIDDDKSIRNLLGYILRENYVVINKKDGLAGLLWMDRGNFPDLILVDEATPEVNGKEFLDIVRSSGYFNNIPVIMVSDHSEINEIKEEYSEANDFLLKPFNPDELHRKIEKLIGV